MRILAVLNRPAAARAVLVAAGMLAARLGGEVTVLHVLSTDEHVPGEEIVPEAERTRRSEAAAQRSAELRAACEADAPPGAVWREVAGEPRARIAEAARDADLVLLGHAPALFYEDAWQAIHGALLDAGAPALLLPDAVPAVLGEHVALAWKPGAAAERAAAAALPLLLLAAGVTVLIGAEHGAAAPAPTMLLDNLGRAGVRHGVHRFDALGGIGAALLREAHGCGADLLVMGAFSHSRLRETVFGGATHDILAGADLPVLLRR